MNLVLSIVMLAAFALVAGAFMLWRGTGDMKKPALMLLLAAIAIANVAIWIVPDESGNVPLSQLPE